MSAREFAYRTRPPKGQASGALVLFHGRGADENDLFPLFDMLDPTERLLGLGPRGPLSLPPGGAHWYVIKELGYPDEDTFMPTFQDVSAWLDATLAESGIGIENTVLGGFSQGAVMAYALGLAKGRSIPAGIMAFSGFIPTIEGLELDLAGEGAPGAKPRKGLPVAIGHGTYDPVIGVEWGRAARDQLTAAGLDVSYRESPMPHTIDPDWVAELAGWLDRVVDAGD